jgi:hypothetical protein
MDLQGHDYFAQYIPLSLMESSTCSPAGARLDILCQSLYASTSCNLLQCMLCGVGAHEGLHEALAPVHIVQLRVFAAALSLLREWAQLPELVHNITCAGATT